MILNIVLLCVFFACMPFLANANSSGVLILAHGVAGHGGGHEHGSHPPHEGDWEQTVRILVENASDRIPAPVELAFGMWDRRSFQAGIDRLAARGATEVRVIPLFISSHSMVIRAQHYMFGLSTENPLWFEPGKVALPATIKEVSFSPALDDSMEFSEALRLRAQELTEDPSMEELVLVAHGPVADKDDELWLRDLAVHASRLGTGQPVHILTLRDDAPPEIRDRMTRQLRDTVNGIHVRRRTALILPVLLAPGGIEAGLLDRLLGLPYRYRGHMMVPDPNLVDWLVRSARVL